MKEHPSVEVSKRLGSEIDRLAPQSGRALFGQPLPDSQAMSKGEFMNRVRQNWYAGGEAWRAGLLQQQGPEAFMAIYAEMTGMAIKDVHEMLEQQMGAMG